MSKTLARHIQIDEQHWRRIESLANERGTTPNQLLVELAIEASTSGNGRRIRTKSRCFGRACSPPKRLRET